MAIQFLNTVAVDTSVLYVDTSINRVGIGTTLPDEILHIKGPTPKIKLEHSSGYFESKIEFYSISTKAGELAVYNNPGFQGVVLSYDQGLAATRFQVESTKFRFTTNDPANYQAEVFIDEYIVHEGDPNTKFGFVANDNFAITTGGVERVRVKSGNVGIGTTSPDTILEVVDENPILTVRDTSTGLSSANSALRLAESGSGDTLGNYWDLKMKPESVGGTTNFAIANSSLGEVLNINYQGNVGIGTSNPGAKLDVNNDAQIDTYSAGTTIAHNAGYIKLLSDAKTGWAPGDEFGKIEFYNRDTSGIGARNAASIRAVNNTGNGSSTTTFEGELAFYTSPYNTAEAEAVRIDSAGNVGIGTTNPTQKLDVVGSIEVSDGIYLGGTAASNHLDDYEEGIYNPEFFLGTSSTAYDSSDFSNFTNYSKYVKVGRKVTIYLSITYTGITTAISTSSQSIGLGSFPFTPARTDFCTGTYNFLYYERPNATTIPQTYGWNGVLGPAYIGPTFSAKVKLRKLVYNSFTTMWSSTGITGGEFPRFGPFNGANYFTAVIHYYTND